MQYRKDNSLDQYLVPVDAPINKGTQISSIQFNAQNDRNNVNSYNLKNFTFNAGTGGTITLGGTNNGNGLLNINNSAGSLIGRFSNRGIFLANNSQSLNIGTDPINWNAQMYFNTGTPRGNFRLDVLSDNIFLETDNGNITLYASQDPTGTGYGTITLAIGTGAQLRINKNNTQIAKLDANGNFLIAGTLGTGIIF